MFIVFWTTSTLYRLFFRISLFTQMKQYAQIWKTLLYSSKCLYVLKIWKNIIENYFMILKKLLYDGKLSKPTCNCTHTKWWRHINLSLIYFQFSSKIFPWVFGFIRPMRLDGLRVFIGLIQSYTCGFLDNWSIL